MQYHITLVVDGKTYIRRGVTGGHGETLAKEHTTTFYGKMIPALKDILSTIELESTCARQDNYTNNR